MEKIHQGEYQTLNDILRAKEERGQFQQQLLVHYHNTLISYKLNIPGGVKYNKMIRRIFDAGIEVLKQRLDKNNMVLLYEKVFYKHSGPEFFGVLADSAPVVKKVTCSIEEDHPLGRLYDFDVIAKSGKPCSREDIEKTGRKCFLCQQPAFVCARSRTHSVAEMLAKIQAMYDCYFIKAQ